MTIHIRAVSASTIHPLRTRVLRPSYAPGTLHIMPIDGLPTTHHVAAVASDGEVLGCATLMRDPCPHYPEHPGVRLRGMAVAPQARRRGIGRALLEHAEQTLLAPSATHAYGALRHTEPLVWWFNARAPAEPFYTACGFARVGELFEIEGIGPHWVMLRVLPPAS